MEQRGPKSSTGQSKRDSGLHGGAKFCWIFHRLITLRTSQGSEGDHEGLNRIPTSTRRLPSEGPIIQYMIVGFHSCPFSRWITGRGSLRLFSFQLFPFLYARFAKLTFIRNGKPNPVAKHDVGADRPNRLASDHPRIVRPMPNNATIR